VHGRTTGHGEHLTVKVLALERRGPLQSEVFRLGQSRNDARTAVQLISSLHRISLYFMSLCLR
jgi:hypothetical protein